MSGPGWALPLALAAALTGGAAAASSGGAPDRGVLTVQGQGVVEVTPDVVDLVLGVETEGATPAEAIDANSAAMTQVVARTLQSRIERRDVQTSTLSLYQRPADGTGRPAPGYRASNTVRVRVREIARLGAVLRDLVGLGANQIQGVRFGASDPTPHLDRARREAVADARRKAELLAEAAGQRLGPVLEIRDAESGPIQGRGEMALRGAVGADVPIEAGELSVRANVAMTWRLLP